MSAPRRERAAVRARGGPRADSSSRRRVGSRSRAVVLALVYLAALRLPLAPVARARDSRGVRRRACLLQAGPEPRLGQRLYLPRRARVLSGAAGGLPPDAGLAHRFDSDRVRGRQGAQRRRHGGGSVSGLLHRAQAHASLVCACSAAAAAVAGPAMLYGPYLMSEALAYPVFLLALATMLRAIDRPSRWMEVAVDRGLARGRPDAAPVRRRAARLS